MHAILPTISSSSPHTGFNNIFLLPTSYLQSPNQSPHNPRKPHTPYNLHLARTRNPLSPRTPLHNDALLDLASLTAWSLILGVALALLSVFLFCSGILLLISGGVIFFVGVCVFSIFAFSGIGRGAFVDGCFVSSGAFAFAFAFISVDGFVSGGGGFFCGFGCFCLSVRVMLLLYSCIDLG